jgi:cytochrome c oxidase subunit 4
MANINTEHKEHQSGNNEVRNVTIILSVLTVVELALGYYMYKQLHEPGFLRNLVKGTIIILMLAKAYYIVAYFMHLGHELRNMIMTIVTPLALFIWFIIAFLYDGNSYKELRNTYDQHYYEQSQIKVDKEEHKTHEEKEGEEKNTEEKHQLD